jgi:hypothetical protein
MKEINLNSLLRLQTHTNLLVSDAKIKSYLDLVNTQTDMRKLGLYNVVSHFRTTETIVQLTDFFRERILLAFYTEAKMSGRSKIYGYKLRQILRQLICEIYKKDYNQVSETSNEFRRLMNYVYSVCDRNKIFTQSPRTATMKKHKLNPETVLVQRKTDRYDNKNYVVNLENVYKYLTYRFR